MPFLVIRETWRVSLGTHCQVYDSINSNSRFLISNHKERVVKLDWATGGGMAQFQAQRPPHHLREPCPQPSWPEAGLLPSLCCLFWPHQLAQWLCPHFWTWGPINALDSWRGFTSRSPLVIDSSSTRNWRSSTFLRNETETKHLRK